VSRPSRCNPDEPVTVIPGSSRLPQLQIDFTRQVAFFLGEVGGNGTEHCIWRMRHGLFPNYVGIFFTILAWPRFLFACVLTKVTFSRCWHFVFAIIIWYWIVKHMQMVLVQPLNVVFAGDLISVVFNFICRYWMPQSFVVVKYFWVCCVFVAVENIHCIFLNTTSYANLISLLFE